MDNPTIPIYLRNALVCLAFLGGLGLGIFFIVRKKVVVGALTLAGIVLLSLDPVLQRLIFLAFGSDVGTITSFTVQLWAQTCLAGGASLLGKAALLAALVLAVRPEPAAKT